MCTGGTLSGYSWGHRPYGHVCTVAWILTALVFGAYVLWIVMSSWLIVLWLVCSDLYLFWSFNWEYIFSDIRITLLFISWFYLLGIPLFNHSLNAVCILDVFCGSNKMMNLLFLTPSLTSLCLLIGDLKLLIFNFNQKIKINSYNFINMGVYS